VAVGRLAARAVAAYRNDLGSLRLAESSRLDLGSRPTDARSNRIQGGTVRTGFSEDEPRVTRPELGSLTVGTVVLTGAGRFLIAAVAPQARADRFEQG
jgi:hypothetical protein